jgi:nicotinate phosphoribosyltransferase
MSALNTDLYELTMAAGYFAAGKANDIATFELTVRRLPENRNFLLAAGLEQVIEYLTAFRFEQDEIEYLRSLDQFRNVAPEFFIFLQDMRFTGDLFAMPEGTPVFPGEPILIVRAPIIQAQLVETYLLSSIAYQTTIASKAIRCVLAAKGRSVVEFGSRRAHSPEAGPLAGRAAYLAGCTGTSNTEAGLRYGIPVFGTAAHSWVMSFGDEEASFRALQQLLGESTVYLVDTYDPLEGTRLAIRLGRPIWGVRLDSGDLAAQGHEVRRLLDAAGFHDVKIMATNDLNEHRIAALLDAGAPIDSFGVGTELATSADAPSLSAVYKLVELQCGESHVYTAKYSQEKSTLPGAKQIYRGTGSDLITLYNDCESQVNGEPLLRPIILHGDLIAPYPALTNLKLQAREYVSKLPAHLLNLKPANPYPVRVSDRLLALAEITRNSRHVVTR